LGGICQAGFRHGEHTFQASWRSAQHAQDRQNTPRWTIQRHWRKIDWL